MQQSIYTDTWLQSVLLYGFLFSLDTVGRSKVSLGVGAAGQGGRSEDFPAGFVGSEA